MAKRRYRLLWFALLTLGAWPARARAQWEPPRLLSSNNAFYGIAASGSAVHAFWGTDPLYYARSTDEGATFGAPRALVQSGGMNPTGPVLASGSYVYVVFFRRVRQATDWCCSRDLGDLFLLRSADGGVTWQPEQRLTSSGSAFRYDLAAAGSAVHLIYSDYRTNQWQIFYLGSDDGGASWRAESRLVANSTNVIEINRPQIAARGASVHATWEDSRDRNPPCYTIPNCPEVYYKRSADGGRSWGSDVRITSDGTAASIRPGIAALGSTTVLLSYQSNRDGNMDAEQEVVRSVDDGMSWSAPLRLSFTPGSSEHDTLIGGGAGAHISWSEDSVDQTSHTVHYRASTDEGATWGADEVISQSIGGQWSIIADLATSAGFVHALWPDADAQRLYYGRRLLEQSASSSGGASGGGGASGSGGASGGGAGGAGTSAAGNGGASASMSSGCSLDPRGHHHGGKPPGSSLLLLLLLFAARFASKTAPRIRVALRCSQPCQKVGECTNYCK